MIEAQRVEDACQSLQPLTKKIIRSSILQYDEAPPKSYDFGQALVFWVADLLTGNKLINTEQLRILLDTFTKEIYKFGDSLQKGWYTDSSKQRRLPVCKLGILDRRLVCMDGCARFLDITTGETMPATNDPPLELIAYNLTTLFLRYKTATNLCSAEQDSTCRK